MIERAYAADTTTPFQINTVPFRAGSKIEDITGSNGLVIAVINIMLEVAAALAIIYIIYSGIMYITSAGNPDKVKKGSQGFFNGLIGIAVVVLAGYIVNAIAQTVSHYGVK